MDIAGRVAICALGEHQASTAIRATLHTEVCIGASEMALGFQPCIVTNSAFCARLAGPCSFAQIVREACVSRSGHVLFHVLCWARASHLSTRRLMEARRIRTCSQPLYMA